MIKILVIGVYIPLISISCHMISTYTTKVVFEGVKQAKRPMQPLDSKLGCCWGLGLGLLLRDLVEVAI